MTRLGRWTLNVIGFGGFLDRLVRDFDIWWVRALTFMVGLAVVATCFRVVFWALTGEW